MIANIELVLTIGVTILATWQYVHFASRIRLLQSELRFERGLADDARRRAAFWADLANARAEGATHIFHLALGAKP